MTAKATSEGTLPQLAAISTMRPLFGCDPEFFFAAPDGHVVGAETVLPDGGLKYNDRAVGTGSRNTTTYVDGGGMVVIDGVQAEMHPHPNTCRANIVFEVAECFRTIKKQLDAKGVCANFKGVVEVDQAVLDALSEAARKLGCSPSKNAYGLGSAELAAIDATTYRTRSAGGHLHMSGARCFGSPESTVEILDAIVGNTCVLLDRDPQMAERRRLYGRAGEFRTPKVDKGQGADLEYRTLSNFWLRSDKLMSFAFGLARLATSIIEAGYAPNIKAAVEREAIITAINTNDFDLARANFNKLRPLIEVMVPSFSGMASLPLGRGVMDPFDFFVDKGLDHWFPGDPVARWCSFTEGHGHGWESFLAGEVTKQYNASKVAAAAQPAA